MKNVNYLSRAFNIDFYSIQGSLQLFLDFNKLFVNNIAISKYLLPSFLSFLNILTNSFSSCSILSSSLYEFPYILNRIHLIGPILCILGVHSFM